MDKLKKKKYDSIQVKPSYIEISLLLRLRSAIPLFFLSWLFFFFLYNYFALEYPISWFAIIILPLSIMTAVLPSSAVILSERILKRLTKTWMYSRFRILLRLSRILIYGTITYIITFFVINWKYGPLPLWTAFVSLALLGLLLVSMVISDFLTYTGEGVLSLMAFLEDFKNKPSNANFDWLLFSAKRISYIAESCNFEVPPYPLSLGITVSLIEHSETTQEKLGDLMEWMQNPIAKASFKKFRRLVKRFNSIAKKSSKDGITEKHHWSFETKITLLGYIVIPIAITLLAIIVPGLIQAYLVK